MVKRLALLTLVFLATSRVAWSQGGETFLGTWTSAPGASETVTLTWEDRGEEVFYVEATGAHSSAPIEIVAFRLDGKDYPYGVKGGSLTTTLALLPIDARTIQATYKMDGGPARKGRWTVSADGKTLAIDRPDGTAWRLAKTSVVRPARPLSLKPVYKGLVGSWQAIQRATGTNTGTVVWEDRGPNFVVATVRATDGKVTMRYSLRFDRREYPCLSGDLGSGVPTISSYWENPLTTHWRILRAGVPSYGSRLVTPDGQTTTVPASAGEKSQDLVWRRVKDAPTDGLLAP